MVLQVALYSTIVLPQYFSTVMYPNPKLKYTINQYFYIPVFYSIILVSLDYIYNIQYI